LCYAFRYYYHFGQTLIDQAAVGLLGRDRLKARFDDQETFYQLARSAKGLILLTSHVGNWRTAMATMDYLDVPVHFQFDLSTAEQGWHFFDLAGDRSRFHFISPSAFLGGMVEMTNALSRGECVCVMGDRSWGAPSRRARFLGADAEFPITAYRLALATGANLAVLLTSRSGPMIFDMEYRLIAPPPGADSPSRDERVDAMLRAYVAALEDLLDRRPFAWFNFFDIWSGRSEP
jgi:predicted LPLAT superfamily acyltransferase